MDRKAWQATVHRVTKSRTHLKPLSTQARDGQGSSGGMCPQENKLGLCFEVALRTNASVSR